MIFDWQIRKVKLHGGYRGIAIFPFILISERVYRQNPVLINHERIHFRQQLELLILPFYILYLGNYLLNRLRYSSHDAAYRNIVFEREAYFRESDLQYLHNRKFFGWRKFLNDSFSASDTIKK